ncbi:NUDIX domain-containing protein [Psychromicrobium lacuslunae]|uniref:ADP-ribose pyrophosphatase n=1 Tax=Psychromicrobium lacuslunae TaxID=1618207 RepID=A0A0D4BWH0_9MICC|nr:NUDIX hydrolase [Psychromicrobium lacuslunae]AJT40649.1 ADP-ribose pyrophosphatase [Psychromicrobium lacuslunae]
MSVKDEPDFRKVVSRETAFHGRIWDVLRDTFELSPGSEQLTREYIDHPGAVAVVVLDEEHNVLLLRQYRHPVRASQWEIPAGLLDIEGEDFHIAAARELAEEADLVASDWKVLLDVNNSAGSSAEAVRIYLARGISAVPEAERHQRTAEEAEITLRWVPLTEAVTAALSGDLHSFSAISGVLAAAAVQRQGFEQLRPADAPWPEHPSCFPASAVSGDSGSQKTS